MKAHLSWLLLLLLLALPLTQTNRLAAQENERVDGLIVSPGWQDVQANCTECHSSLLIAQNSGNRAVWESRIRWMQDTQGMQDLTPEMEESILSYLAENYGQKEGSRRPPLSNHLMPSNPYESNNE